MKLRLLSAVLFSVSVCTPVLAQQIQRNENGERAKLITAGRQIDRKRIPITLRIYNFDQIEPEVIANAKELTSNIFRKAGLQTSWVGCASQESCSTDAGGPEFRVRILPPALGTPMASDHALGIAMPCAATDQACLCYVFYWRIKDLAGYFNIRADRLLGHVMAHEIAHALLGPNAHARYGIMQHNLPLGETERILYFTSDQAKQMQADLLAREGLRNR